MEPQEEERSLASTGDLSSPVGSYGWDRAKEPGTLGGAGGSCPSCHGGSCARFGGSHPTWWRTHRGDLPPSGQVGQRFGRRERIVPDPGGDGALPVRGVDKEAPPHASHACPCCCRGCWAPFSSGSPGRLDGEHRALGTGDPQADVQQPWGSHAVSRGRAHHLGDGSPQGRSWRSFEAEP